MTPWTLRLILANATIFLLSNILPGFGLFVLVPPLVLERPWTLVTYMFLHGGLWHLLFNMLGLFFFGPRLEARLGARQYLTLYFVSGLAGALLSLVLSPAAIIGASAAVFGIFLAFAKFWPREQIFIWGIIPIEARWLVLIMTVIALLGAGGIGGGGIAHFAHLGGFAGGFLYLKWLDWRSPGERFRRKAQPVRRTSPSERDLKRWSAIPRDGMHEVNRTELDRILDKISERGIDSLTPGERETLERFSRQ